MRNIPNKSPGDQLTSPEFNDFKNETQNTIEDVGITLSSGDLKQLSKAISAYSSAGDFYSDSGSANAYVLSPLGNYQAVFTLRDGMRFRFRALNSNTGASTANVAGTGAKNILNTNESALTPGEIVAGDEVVLSYSSASGGHYTLTNRNDFATNIPFGIAEEDTPNNYTLDLEQTFTVYNDRMYFRCTFDTANTGAVNINVDGLGNKQLVGGRDFYALGSGEIKLHVVYLIAFSTARNELLIVSASTLQEILLDKYVGTTSGTASALTLNPTRNVASVGFGSIIVATAHVTVAAGATLDFGGSGPLSIAVAGITGNVLIEANSWTAGDAVVLLKGTSWLIMSPIMNASQTDATARISVTKALTPAILDTQQATTALKGLAYLALTSEVNTPPSTQATKMMTAALTESFYDVRKASQVLAEAGTDNYYYMTSLRTDNFYQTRKASGAQVYTGTDTNKFAPIDKMEFHRGVSKAMINVDCTGATGIKTPRASHNLSLNKTSIGIFTLTFGTAMATANYFPQITTNSPQGHRAVADLYGTPSASSFQIQVRRVTDAAPLDPEYLIVTVDGQF